MTEQIEADQLKKHLVTKTRRKKNPICYYYKGVAIPSIIGGLAG